MSWLDALGAAAGNAIRTILSEASSPNKVLDVKSGQYSNRFIHCREEALVLYGPSQAGSRAQEKYEIVLHRPCSETLHQAFRLVRIALKYCSMYFIIFLLLCVVEE
jgi:calcium-independent phospholipase A2